MTYHQPLHSVFPPADKIPAMLLTPLDWALQSQWLAAEYAGMPEGKEFLVAARRFMALAARITTLENELYNLKLTQK